MFGFSITKVIFTVLIVFGVWQLFKYFGRLQDERDEHIRMGRKGGQNGGESSTGSGGNSTPEGVEDMVLCPVCESYVARGAKSCGRDDCPYRG